MVACGTGLGDCSKIMPGLMPGLIEDNIERNGSQTDMRLGVGGCVERMQPVPDQGIWATLIDCATSHQGENLHS